MTKKIELPQIHLAAKHKRDLEKKHDCSRNTVILALKYHIDSPLAQEIRKSAKEILQKEADEVANTGAEFSENNK